MRVTGFFVPRREAVVGVDQEGSKVTDVLVREGDTVTDNQELARLTPPPQNPGQPQRRGPKRRSRCAPRPPGLVTEVRTIVGAPASPQAGPMFRIAVNNEIELDAAGPGRPHAEAQPRRDGADQPRRRARSGRPGPAGCAEIDRATQLGHVRIIVTNNPSLKVGMFARATIDAKRSCGVAVPRTAIDHLTVQVVKGNTVETRKVRVGLMSDTSIGNPRRPRRRRNRRGRRRLFAA